ncbi:hypothetical protein IT084_12325 [Desulfallas sp. Bu1-1]|jgi:hypothetical protein|uniref:hypothetical protein n=1 Tax=Desulfallas sp. Bu1-1 TaxID=2787620 RepID=UPI00189E02D7|nr:hypothetical protein [Desulfallas sp. Bu1-1]MBF7083759.1 hypothetical protein [Desulfallas sp. Bu1-1]
MAEEKIITPDRPEINKDSNLTKTVVNQNFFQRLDQAFQDTMVNVEFQTFEDSIKKVVGALLTRISTPANLEEGYLELVSPIPSVPFTVLTFLPGVATPVNIEFATAILIPDLFRIISVERIF